MIELAPMKVIARKAAAHGRVVFLAVRAQLVPPGAVQQAGLRVTRRLDPATGDEQTDPGGEP